MTLTLLLVTSLLGSQGLRWPESSAIEKGSKDLPKIRANVEALYLKVKRTSQISQVTEAAIKTENELLRKPNSPQLLAKWALLAYYSRADLRSRRKVNLNTADLMHQYSGPLVNDYEFVRAKFLAIGAMNPSPNAIRVGERLLAIQGDDDQVKDVLLLIISPTQSESSASRTRQLIDSLWAKYPQSVGMCNRRANIYLTLAQQFKKPSDRAICKASFEKWVAMAKPDAKTRAEIKKQLRSIGY